MSDFRSQPNSASLVERLESHARNADYTSSSLICFEAAERIAELESNEKAYEEIIGKKTYREVADRIRDLEAALLNCRTAYCGYSITKNDQYPDVIENFWKELRRIDKTARVALQPRDTAP
jgi:hypothetical protein